MASDPRYDYPRINAVKVIIQSDSGKILLLQEPETNEWMPLHWGLPGGKSIKNEFLIDAYKRKLKEEVGIDLAPDGIFRIEEILHYGRTVLMFIFVLIIDKEFNPKGESKNYKWFSLKEIGKMPVKEFTEYYNKKLLSDFNNNQDNLIPLSVIESWDHSKMEENKEYIEWLKSGK